IMIAIPSVMIGVGVLSMPKDLAADTKAGDGWLPIVGIGVLILFVIWFITRFVARFPGQQFIEYAALIVSKPVAVIMTLVWAGIFIPLTSIQIREIANMSKEYLLPETPIEIIALTFFLVVIYAVSGTRVGLFRLNMLFFPIITLIVLVVFVFNLNFFSISHLQPLFKTSFTGFIKGAGSSIRSYIGFGILWFYLAYVEEPKQTSKLAVIGTIISFVLYVLLFFFRYLYYGYFQYNIAHIRCFGFRFDICFYEYFEIKSYFCFGAGRLLYCNASSGIAGNICFRNGDELYSYFVYDIGDVCFDRYGKNSRGERQWVSASCLLV